MVLLTFVLILLNITAVMLLSLSVVILSVRLTCDSLLLDVIPCSVCGGRLGPVSIRNLMLLVLDGDGLWLGVAVRLTVKWLLVTLSLFTSLSMVTLSSVVVLVWSWDVPVVVPC